MWYEFGYDKTGKIKKCDDGQSIYHPTKKQIYELCDEIKIQKMIINPFYTHVNRQQRNKTFYIEFYKNLNDTDTSIKMYRGEN